MKTLKHVRIALALIAVLAVSAAVGSAVGLRQTVTPVSAYTENYYEPETQPEPLKENEFTLAVIGDTQCVVEHGFDHFTKTAEWLVQNKDELKLAYMFHMGDVVNDIVDKESEKHQPDPDYQFKLSRQAFDIIDASDIEYSLVLGNHDYVNYINKGVREFDKFNEYFPLSVVSSMPGYGGSMDGTTLENVYSTFSAGGTDYLVITMGFKPRNDTLVWAGSIIEKYPNHKVIISTHSYLSAAAGARNTVGQRIWENLVCKYENIEYVFCGHDCPDVGYQYQTSYGIHGNIVHEIMVNSQYMNEGGKANLMLMRFRNNGKIECNLYCPSEGKALNDPFVIEIDPERPTPPKEQVDGNTVCGPYSVNYGSFNTDSEVYDSLYSHANIAVSEAGISAREGEIGAMTIAAVADEGNVFRSLTLTLDCDNTGVIQLYAGEEGKLGIVHSFPAGKGKMKLDLTWLVNNTQKFLMRFVLSGSASISGLTLESDEVRVFDNGDSPALDLQKDFTTGYEDYDISLWSAEALRINDMLVWGGFLGTGAKSTSSGAEAYAVYRFASENKTFENFTVTMNGRLNGAYLGFYLRLYVSTDNGQSWQLCVDEQKSADPYSRVVDLSEVFAGTNNAMIRLEMFGDYWHSVGLRSLAFHADYRFSINYDAGAGVAADNPESYVYGDEFDLNSPTAPEYYTFAGWYDNEDFEGNAIYKITKEDSGSKTLYAKYRPKTHKIAYNLGGGRNSADNPQEYAEAEGSKLSPAVRTGYAFLGWYEKEDFSGSPIEEIAVGSTEDVELYARWAKSYRITYVLGGGTMEGGKTSYNETESFSLGAPVREGYEFEGWYETADFSGERIDSVSAGRTGELILYAKWSTAGKSKGGCGSAANASALGITTFIGAALCRRRANKN